MKKIMLLLALASFLTLGSNAQEETSFHYEKDYVEKWCTGDGYQKELRLRDGTYVDCYINNKLGSYAAEFDFSNKWQESIVQALHYSHLTGGKPVVVLINKGNYGEHQKRLRTVLSNYINTEVSVICLDENAVQYDCVY